MFIFFLFIALVTACPPNSIPNDGQCISCEGGYVSTGEGTCNPCGPGTFAGRGVCLPCPVGTYGPSSALEQCSACPPGQVARQAGLSICATCPPGYRSVGTTECNPCPPGHITINGTCNPCPAGTAIRSGVCEECDVGMFSPYPGTSCLYCPAGYYSMDPGASACNPCRIGFTTSNDTVVCRQCPAGQTTVYEGSPTCVSTSFFVVPCDRLPDPYNTAVISLTFVCVLGVSLFFLFVYTKCQK